MHSIENCRRVAARAATELAVARAVHLVLLPEMENWLVGFCLFTITALGVHRRPEDRAIHPIRVHAGPLPAGVPGPAAALAYRGYPMLVQSGPKSKPTSPTDSHAADPQYLVLRRGNLQPVFGAEHHAGEQLGEQLRVELADRRRH